MAGPIPPKNGGTGVDNGTNTVTVTGGNLEFKLPASGSYTLPSAGTMLNLKAAGSATLVGGTVTVSVPGIAANDYIMIIPTAFGGTPGFVRVSAITVGTSFALTSSSALDTSTYSYVVLDWT